MSEKINAEQILKKHCNNKQILLHSKIVKDISLEICKYIDSDRNLVEIGATLHDIGRTKTRRLNHGIIGAQILNQENIKKEIQDFCTNHIGVGLTKEQAQKLGLPKKDYLPTTIEQKIVTYADNLVKYNKTKKTYKITTKNYIINKLKSEQAQKFMDEIENMIKPNLNKLKKYIKEYNLRLKNKL
jgi:uncharacterized protein (TIGR00295 family)